MKTNMKKSLLTLCALVGLYAGANAQISKSKVDSIAVAKATIKYGSTNFEQDSWFRKDAFNFAVASVIVRDEICGYHLRDNLDLAVTTDISVNPDSSKVYGTRCAVIDTTTATVQSTEDIIQALYDDNTLGSTGVEGEPVTTPTTIKPYVKFQSPNDGKNFNVFGKDLNGLETKIYNIQGQYVTTGQINNGKVCLSEKISQGKYISIIPMNIGGKIHYITQPFVVIR